MLRHFVNRFRSGYIFHK